MSRRTAIVCRCLLLAQAAAAARRRVPRSPIDAFMVTGKPPYSVERTMHTGGILDYALESRVRKKELATPDLDISYSPPKDSGFIRWNYVAPD